MRHARSAAGREPLARDLSDRPGQCRPARPSAALRLSLARSDDKLEIEELRLGLPGGSRGELQGVVTGPPEAPVFDGSIGLRGTSLVRFLGWATAGAPDLRPQGRRHVRRPRRSCRSPPGASAARNIVGDLSGTAISADAQYRWEGRPELSLSLEGPQLDARAFIPAGSSLGDIFDVVLHGPLMSHGDKPGAARGLGAGQARLARRADRRLHPHQRRAAHHRRAHLSRRRHGDRAQGRPPRLPLLRIAGDDGFSLELEGEVDDAASRPKGSLRGRVGADSGAAIAPLAELLGIPEAFRPDARRARAMVPLRLGRLAWRSAPARPPPPTWCSTARPTGLASSSTPASTAPPAGWRTGPADVTGLVEGNDAQAIAGAAGPRRIRGPRRQSWLGPRGGQSRPACPARGWRRSPRSRPAIWRSTSADG